MTWPQENSMQGSFEITWTNTSFFLLLLLICKVPDTVAIGSVEGVNGQAEFPSNTSKGYWSRLRALHRTPQVSDPCPVTYGLCGCGDHFLLKAHFLVCAMVTAAVGARPVLSRVPGTQPSTQWEWSWWEVILGRLLLVISLTIPAHSVLWDHSLLNFCQVGLDQGKEHKSKDTKHSFKEYMVSLGRIVTCALKKSTDVLTATQGRVPRWNADKWETRVLLI